MFLLIADLLQAAVLAESKQPEAIDHLEKALEVQDGPEPIPPAEELERALISCGKMLCDNGDPSGSKYLRRARKVLHARTQTRLHKSMAKRLEKIIENLPPEMKLQIEKPDE
jgi:hypothetical protein